MNVSHRESRRSERTLGFDQGLRVGATRTTAERAQRRKLLFWRTAAILQGYALITLAIIHYVVPQ